MDALSSADAFVAATKDGNNGVFEDALGEDAARKAFSANKSEYTVYFKTTENTRYGAIALKERVSAEFTPTDGDAMVEAAAVHGTRFQYDGATTENDDNDVEVGRVGAFSYATVADTLRSRNLLQTGGAVYEGRHGRGHAGRELSQRRHAQRRTISASRRLRAGVPRPQGQDNNL